MNKEVEKIIQEKIKNKNKKENIFKKIKKWWGNNSYKVFRVVLFPVWFFILGKQKLNKYLDSKEKWNEDRVNEILNYFVPRRSGLCFDDEKYLKFFDNGYGWDSKKIIKKICKEKR